MSVIVGGDKIIVHSYIPPIVFDSIQEPDKRYVIADGKWTEIPFHLGQKHIIHFKKEYKNSKNEAFKNNYETEVAGSKGKSYTVKCESNVWSCTCPAFGFSGNSGCKHITQVKTDNKWN
jgi:hypothetical protein